MKISTITTALITVTLAACSTYVQPVDDNLSSPKSSHAPTEWHHYVNRAFKYQIDIPPTAYIPNKSQTGSQIFFGDIPVFTKPIGDEFDIDLYGRTSVSCSPSLTGASQTTELSEAGAKAAWGRVDVFDTPTGEGEVRGNLLCRPPIPPITERLYFPCIAGGMEGEDCEEKFRQYELENGMYSAYALCSEKNGKTVVVCISQMTDNPTLAEQIFETFRWTD